MANGDYIEYSIAHDRKYTLDHVWVQALDDKAESVKIGVSEFVPAESVSYTHLTLPTKA